MIGSEITRQRHPAKQPKTDWLPAKTRSNNGDFQNRLTRRTSNNDGELLSVRNRLSVLTSAQSYSLHPYHACKVFILSSPTEMIGAADRCTPPLPVARRAFFL